MSDPILAPDPEQRLCRRGLHDLGLPENQFPSGRLGCYGCHRERAYRMRHGLPDLAPSPKGGPAIPCPHGAPAKSQCPECVRQRHRAWRLLNTDHRREYHRDWYIRNRKGGTVEP